MATIQETETADLRKQLTRQAEVSRLKDGLLMDALGKPVRRVLQLDLFDDGGHLSVTIGAVNSLRLSAAPVRIQLLDGVVLQDAIRLLEESVNNLMTFASQHAKAGVVEVQPP